VFTTSRAAALVADAQSNVDGALDARLPATKSTRASQLARAREQTREATLLLATRHNAKDLQVAAESLEVSSRVAQAVGEYDEAFAVAAAAGALMVEAMDDSPHEVLARIARLTASWLAGVGLPTEAAHFALEHLKRTPARARRLENVAYAALLAQSSGMHSVADTLMDTYPPFSEPLPAAVILLEHHRGRRNLTPNALALGLRRMEGAGLDIEMELGLTVVGDTLKAGEPQGAEPLLEHLTRRAAEFADSYLYQARLWQARATVAVRQQRWRDAIEQALKAWLVFDEVMYKSGVPRFRSAIHRLARHCRFAALTAATQLDDNRLVIELIESSRLQSTIDIIGAAADVDETLATGVAPPPRRHRSEPNRTITATSFPYADLLEFTREVRSDLAPPIDLTVSGVSVLRAERSRATAGLLFEPQERRSVNAQDVLAGMNGGRFHWLSTWYEGGSHFSALARDGMPVSCREHRIVDDEALRAAATTIVAGYGAQPPWPVGGQVDIDAAQQLSTCDSSTELRLTEPLARLLPDALRVDAGAEGRPLLISCAPELVGIPWPILPVDVSTRPSKRLVEVHELRFLPALTALLGAHPRRPDASPVPFYLYCEHLPEGKPLEPRTPAMTALREGRVDPREGSSVENVVRTLRRIPPGAPGLAFFRTHYVSVDGDPASSGVVLANGILESGMVGVRDEHGQPMAPMPSRVILACCASSGVRGRGGGEALGMAAMCLKAGARRVIATSVPIDQTPFTDALDEMLIDLGITADDQFRALRSLHLRLLEDWRLTSARGSASSDDAGHGPTPHIWAHYQALGLE
jgi:hypothetical protein